MTRDFAGIFEEINFHGVRDGGIPQRLKPAGLLFWRLSSCVVADEDGKVVVLGPGPGLE